MVLLNFNIVVVICFILFVRRQGYCPPNQITNKEEYKEGDFNNKFNF